MCAISPIGFAAGRERGYAQVMLRSIRALAHALDGIAEAAYRSPVRRTALMSLIVAKPANVPRSPARI